MTKYLTKMDEPNDDKLFDRAYLFILELYRDGDPNGAAMRKRLDAFLPDLHWRVYDHGWPYYKEQHVIDLPPMPMKP